MTIDIRSDAITQATTQMWDAMESATVGWALPGEDKNIEELEAFVSDLVDKEVGLYLPSGTTANLLALLGHSHRGDQIILDDLSHILWSEEWGFAKVCGLAHRTVSATRGQIDPEELDVVIGQHSFDHRPRTALICLENSHNGSGGAILTPSYMSLVGNVASKHGIPIHVDGARLMNVCSALNIEARELVKNATSVSINLNKSLSAPIGSVLCGDKIFIEICRSFAKRFGVLSIHQAGIFAAAGLVAIREMVPQTAIDNTNARLLVDALSVVGSSVLNIHPADTNIVFVEVQSTKLTGRDLQNRLKKHGVLVSLARDNIIRMVTHRHFSEADINQVTESMKAALEDIETI